MWKLINPINIVLPVKGEAEEDFPRGDWEITLRDVLTDIGLAGDLW